MFVQVSREPVVLRSGENILLDLVLHLDLMERGCVLFADHVYLKGGTYNPFNFDLNIYNADYGPNGPLVATIPSKSHLHQETEVFQVFTNYFVPQHRILRAQGQPTYPLARVLQELVS